MRSMVEWASTGPAPSTPLRAVPLPRFAGEDGLDFTADRRRFFYRYSET